MDSEILSHILQLAIDDAEREKVKLILSEAEPLSVSDIPDPYWNDKGFEEVFRVLDEACEAIVKKYAVKV